MKRIALCFLIFLAYMVSALSFLHAEKAPLDFNAFDGQPVGARAIALGGALTGIANDASAPYWNPAGLTLLPGNAFTVCSYLQRESDTKWEEVIKSDPLRGGKLAFLSFAAPAGALAIRPLSKIAGSSYVNENGKEVWIDKKASVNELMFSVAKMNKDNFYTGVSLNYINSNLAVATRTKDAVSDITTVNVDSGNGWSLDLGMLFTADSHVTLGITALNVLGYLYWSDYSKNRIPLTLRTGVAMMPLTNVLFTYDFQKVYYPDNDDISTKHIGLEYRAAGMVTLRAGMNGQDWNDPLKVNYNFGLGFGDKSYALDIAMQKSKIQDSVILDKLNNVFTYIVSLSMPFGS